MYYYSDIFKTVKKICIRSYDLFKEKLRSNKLCVKRYYQSKGHKTFIF